MNIDLTYLPELATVTGLTVLGFFLRGTLINFNRRLDKVEDATEATAVTMAVMSKDVSTLDVRHSELEKTVTLNDKLNRDGSHEIRTIIGTQYATRAELQSSVNSLQNAMQIGFDKVIKDIRQTITDLGLVK